MRRSLLFVLLCCLLSAPALAGVIWTPQALLTDMFSDAQSVEWLRFELSPEQRAQFEKRAGYAPPKASYTFYVGRAADGHPLGWALLDDQQGQHQPIDFAVQIGPDGAVMRQEVVVYREAYGEEIRNPRFRAQFVGKRSTDPLRAGGDVIIISGATISSRAMAVGVKRALILYELLIASGASPSRSGP